MDWLYSWFVEPEAAGRHSLPNEKKSDFELVNWAQHESKQTESKTSTLLQHNTVSYFKYGEKSLAKASAFFILRESANGENERVQGQLILTSYRLLFLRSNASSVMISLPLCSIASLENSSTESSSIEIMSKDFRMYLWQFVYDPSQLKICQKLKNWQWHKHMEDAFAFRLKPSGTADSGWEQFIPQREFERMGIEFSKSSPFRLATLNQAGNGREAYGFSPTYPSVFVVPSAITDDDLEQMKSFRGKGRVPAIIYRHPNGATLSRCAQPLVGLRRFRCHQDEKYVALLRINSKTNFSKPAPIFHIVDCRSQTAAFANFTIGGGYENSSHYQDIEMLFMNIENIHAVRESYRRLMRLVRSLWQGRDEFWHSQFEGTGWLRHIQALLRAGAHVARLTEDGHSSLVHCSDGWDRTPQTLSIAQILLDGYYRTKRGFEILIEKDWVSFGHCFRKRTGIECRDPFASDNMSPIFLQFLDVVHQLIHQFPDCFEFNDEYLLQLMEQVFSGESGTFLGDCERQREACHVRELSLSAWALLQGHPDYQSFRNPLYDSKTAKRVLRPFCRQKDLKSWNRLFLRTWPVARLPTRTLQKLRERNEQCEDLEQKLKSLKNDFNNMEMAKKETDEQLRTLLLRCQEQNLVSEDLLVDESTISQQDMDGDTVIVDLQIPGYKNKGVNGDGLSNKRLKLRRHSMACTSDVIGRGKVMLPGGKITAVDDYIKDSADDSSQLPSENFGKSGRITVSPVMGSHKHTMDSANLDRAAVHPKLSAAQQFPKRKGRSRSIGDYPFSSVTPSKLQ
eukprot:TRINITY_DN33306_c0_g2_i1.p1 TRINITY_DN33306_c0_g2~~TRINITY_DN33306_c0_g2_i1.p1  ORF type:complete len:794 (-),score=183.02 TRINITY_DN33306_c0_g2_i1:215-2596(-)